VASIHSFAEEWEEHLAKAIGTICIGDLNLHHIHWLRFSASTSVEGTAMFRFCLDHGFAQRVQKPTRGEHLLDLVVTDLGSSTCTCTVHPEIADHKLVLVRLHLGLPATERVQRELWQFCRADWGGLGAELASADWRWLDEVGPTEGAQALTNLILQAARRHIPTRWVVERKVAHPWLNERCLELVAERVRVAGSDLEPEAAAQCSAGILEEYFKYVARCRTKLRELRRGSKQWWRLSRELMCKAPGSSCTPALKDSAGEWVVDAVGKADLFATTFEKKFWLPEVESNEFSPLVPCGDVCSGFLLLRTRCGMKFLQKLRVDSATGPDGLASRILKLCAGALAVPFVKLARRIVRTGVWPEGWTVHWVHPLHKKKSVYEPTHYRGIHLTPQISKAMERFIGSLFMPFLSQSLAWGPAQFAYTEGRGARDAVALYVISWILGLSDGHKIAVYSSDVSGAFDRVSSERLLEKMGAKGVHRDVIQVVKSWLRGRTAMVVVDGAFSRPMRLADMVYQGTVWGPGLWNTFYEDARHAVNQHGFQEVVYADDFNSFKLFPRSASNYTISAELRQCQSSLHRWGRANQVTFDAGKEHLCIISTTDPQGDPFEILGVEFDLKLQMGLAVHACATSASWRLKTLLRTQRFYNDAELICLFKAHVLSYVEYRTPAIYHAATTVLRPIDHILDSFLRQVGVSPEDSLEHFRLAPLRTRRDIAMLGLIHRTLLGKGPVQFQRFFIKDPASVRTRRRRHTNHLVDPRDRPHLDVAGRSVLGLIRVYNLLPQSAIDCPSVACFQRFLQQLVRERMRQGRRDWADTLSPRLPLLTHPLMRLNCLQALPRTCPGDWSANASVTLLLLLPPSSSSSSS